MHYQNIIDFWFKETPTDNWFKKDENFDKTIIERFSDIYHQAANGELAHWRKEPLGRLAEIIILDQFPRNMFRNDAKSFTTDPLALILSQEAITNEVDKSLTTQQKAFLYMPFMHSESKFIHEQAMQLFNQPGLEHNLEFEIKHKDIIDQFGRYPHRNAILNRQSTAEELKFLETNSGF